MQAARLVKSDLELAVMQEACAIAEAVTESAIAAVAPGVREYDVVADAMHTLYRLGGEMAHLATPFVASGEHMSPPNRFASDKLIREGDLVFIDIGAMWSGYYSDMGRTVICGEPSSRQQEVFTAVRRRAGRGDRRDATRETRTTTSPPPCARRGRERGLGESFLSLFIGHGDRGRGERAALRRRGAARRRDGRAAGWDDDGDRTPDLGARACPAVAASGSRTRSWSPRAAASR